MASSRAGRAWSKFFWASCCSTEIYRGTMAGRVEFDNLVDHPRGGNLPIASGSVDSVHIRYVLLVGICDGVVASGLKGITSS